MGITLEEAIKHAEKVAEVKEKEGSLNQESFMPLNDFMKYRVECLECASEHRQLAEWLKDYKRLLEQEPKTGHWIPMGIVDENGNRNYECSECHHSDVQAESMTVPYCWFCGAKMIKPQESENKE